MEERGVRTHSSLVTRYELAQDTAERAQQCGLDCGLDDGRLHRSVGAVVATKANVMYVFQNLRSLSIKPQCS